MSITAESAEMAAFASRVKSFIPGRVRVRHPALRRRDVAEESQRMLAACPGVKTVEVNPAACSALIIYDPAMIAQDALVSQGVSWCRWLDARA